MRPPANVSGVRPSKEAWQHAALYVGLELAKLPLKITAIPEQHLVEEFAAHRPNQTAHSPGELNCYIESIGNSINQRATYWLVRLNSTAPISQFGSRR